MPGAGSMAEPAAMFTVTTLIAWYRQYAADLRVAREAQRELLAQRPLRPRVDDLEAEILYLTVRALRPGRVLESGAGRGWSTTWLLRALRDNDFGELYSTDARDAAPTLVPDELSRTRWHFRRSPAAPAAPSFVVDPGAVAARRGLPPDALTIDPDLRDHLLSVKRRLHISAPVHRGRPARLRFFAPSGVLCADRSRE
jgi:hypothetical protein